MPLSGKQLSWAPREFHSSRWSWVCQFASPCRTAGGKQDQKDKKANKAARKIFYINLQKDLGNLFVRGFQWYESDPDFKVTQPWASQPIRDTVLSLSSINHRYMTSISHRHCLQYPHSGTSVDSSLILANQGFGMSPDAQLLHTNACGVVRPPEALESAAYVTWMGVSWEWKDTWVFFRSRNGTTYLQCPPPTEHEGALTAPPNSSVFLHFKHESPGWPWTSMQGHKTIRPSPGLIVHLSRVSCKGLSAGEKQGKNKVYLKLPEKHQITTRCSQKNPEFLWGF